MIARKRFAIVVTSFLAAIVALTLVSWSVAKKSKPPFLEGAGPNAYDGFVAASKMLIGSPDKPQNEAEFVHTNAPAFDRITKALEQTFEAPIETYDLQTYASLVMPNLAAFKRLGQALKAKGAVAEEAQRYGEAASVYMDLIQFGQSIQAGPAMFLLIGLSVEELGVKALEQLSDHLNEQEKRAAIARLEKLADRRVGIQEVLKREKYFMRSVSRTPFHYLLSLRMAKSALLSAERKYDREVKLEEELLDHLRGSTKAGMVKY